MHHSLGALARRGARSAAISVLAVAMVAATLLMANPATAESASPSAQCGPGDLFTIVLINPYNGLVEHYTRPVASHGGCVSSTAHGTGELSGSALAGQCKRIEGVLERIFGYAYPHAFYGKFPAKNRADCIEVMHGLSTGELDSGLPVPFPF